MATTSCGGALEPCQLRQRLVGGKDAVAQGGEIARPAAADRQPRQRARHVGRGAQDVADVVAHRLIGNKRSRWHRAARAITAASVSGAASRCASSRDPADVTVQSIASSSDPRRSPESVRVNSRLARVAGSIAIVVPAASRVGGDSGGRFPTCVRSI